MAEMIPIKEAAACWNITERRVATLCKDGKIIGAEKQGKRWMIPADTQKPVDQRIKTGAFRKTERATRRPLPIGVSNYCLASSEYYYIDKTMMIKDFIDERPMVTLFTRPRRFGKTLNMDMLRTFFEKSDEDTSVYFRDKKIWSCGQKYRDYQGKYPVIFLTFKDVKFDTWTETFAAIRDIFAKETRRHKELLTSSESKTVEEIMDTNMLYARTTDDQEDVANIITKYGLIALPIVDHENCMVGIVTVDDAMQVLQDETTEDISIMAGVNPNEDSYFGTSIFEHVKSRIPWLLFLMLSATVTQMIMNSYENALALMPQLAGFVPMLTGTGGNCGSQSSTLVIRGLAVGEIEFSDLFKVIWKEIRIAFCISIILSVVNGIRIMLMGQGDAMMAFTIGLTMACTVLIAKVVGCTLPLIAKKIGLDPAIMATPLISTLVDISTISVYFAIVSYVFHL